MPNGGSDCCGTCWFSSKNEGKAGYHAIEKEGEVICEIRQLKIENPFWTYCANHRHHSLEKISVPIGAVYVCKEGFPYEREVWVISPDTEQIRTTLLGLLNKMPEQPVSEYPTSTKQDYEVIIQLGLFRDNRAIEGLKRVLAFNIDKSSDSADGFAWDRRFTVGHALESLARISFNEALPFIERFIVYGLNNAVADGEDRYAVLRYYSVKSLKHSPTKETKQLVHLAETDPNLEISTLAKQTLTEF